MEREIKFRAWETNKGLGSRMSKPFTLFDVHNSGLGTFGDSFIVMQFTGLKDKEGKEIYEGDILNENILVVWREDLSSFALRKDGWLYDHYFGEAVDPGRVEVIGNKYQNPELLETKH